MRTRWFKLAVILMYALLALRGQVGNAGSSALAAPPQVHANGSVSFQYLDPAVSRGVLLLQDLPIPFLERRAGGIWTLTTKPLLPQISDYQIEVD